jgi:hypothetical protein
VERALAPWRRLVDQGVGQGHQVTALVRDRRQITGTDRARLGDVPAKAVRPRP